ncbi:MAG: hypothetical protein ACREPK_10165 [Rhodanobacteraceae bacterium]
MGYVYVQPDAANGGGYYTGDLTYSGQGYYDYYGTGPYYPGTSGYGYYNGTYPYYGAFGWEGGYAGDYGYLGGYPYVSRFTFNIGISNVWNFPGYWGPWYSTVIPIWRCRHRGCTRYGWRGQRHQHGQGGQHHAGDQRWPRQGTATPNEAMATGTLALNPQVQAEIARTRRLVKPLPTLLPPGQYGYGYRRASTSFVRDDTARMSVRTRTAATPARPAYFAHPLNPAVANQRARMVRNPVSGPRDFSAYPRRSYRAPVPKFVNRAALTRDAPAPVYHGSRSSARPAYRPATPSSSHTHVYRPRTH